MTEKATRVIILRFPIVIDRLKVLPAYAEPAVIAHSKEKAIV